MILIIPSAAPLDVELSLETGADTHALIPVSGKPLFVHIVELYRKVYPENLKIFLVLRKDCSDLLSNYKDCIHQCIETPESQSIYDTVYAGLTEAYNGVHHDEEVIINMGDTLLAQDDLHLKGDYIYASQGNDTYRWTTFTEKDGNITIESDRSVSHDVDKEDLLSIGVYSFSSIASLREVFLDREQDQRDIDPFFKMVESYSKVNSMHVSMVENWMDFGHLDTYYESKLSHQNLRHFNSLEFETKSGMVTKRSEDSNFVHQVRWFRLQPKEIQCFLPRIYDYSDDSLAPFISMEILTLPTLSDLFVGQRLNLGAWSTVFNRLKDIRNIYRKYSYKSDAADSMLYAMYVSKTIDRLNLHFKNNPQHRELKCASFCDGFSLGELPNLIEKYVTQHQLLFNRDISPIHGDFCLTNLLYDQRSSMVKMIDPRGVFSVPGDYGDPDYDIAKLFHSIVSGYDFIVTDLFSVSVSSNIISYCIKKSKYHDSVAQMAQNVFTPMSKDNKRVRVIESLLFLSMIPLHKDRPDRQMVMAAIGLELFNRYYKKESA